MTKSDFFRLLDDNRFEIGINKTSVRIMNRDDVVEVVLVVTGHAMFTLSRHKPSSSVASSMLERLTRWLAIWKELENEKAIIKSLKIEGEVFVPDVEVSEVKVNKRYFKSGNDLVKAKKSRINYPAKQHQRFTNNLANKDLPHTPSRYLSGIAKISRKEVLLKLRFFTDQFERINYLSSFFINFIINESLKTAQVLKIILYQSLFHRSVVTFLLVMVQINASLQKVIDERYLIFRDFSE